MSNAKSDGTQQPAPSTQHPKIDLARTRTEVYDRPAKLPRVSASDIRSDLKRRDFTINAMAWDLVNQRLIDPFEGLADLRRRIIRVLHDRSFDDDPTRIFRAVRFSVRLGFAIEPRTARLMRKAVAGGRLRLLSGERVLNELRLIAREERGIEMLCSLDRYGVFKSVFGNKLPAEVCRNPKQAPRDPTLRLTYLLATLASTDDLPLSREVSADIASLREFPVVRPRLQRAKKPSAIYEALKPMTRPALQILLGTERRAIKSRIAAFLLSYACAEPILRGADLKALGIPPGPIYTLILDSLRAARLDGKVKTRDEEMALADKILSEELKRNPERNDR